MALPQHTCGRHLCPQPRLQADPCPTRVSDIPKSPARILRQKLPSAFANHSQKSTQEKLKAVKDCLNFEEVSQHSESRTPSKRRDLRKRIGSRRVRSGSRSHVPRRGRPEPTRKKDSKRKTVFKRLENGVFHKLGDKGKSMSAYSNDSGRQSYHSSHRDTESCYQNSCSRGTELASEKRYNKRATANRTEALYDDLKEAFLANFRQQKKCIKDPVEIHQIKQKEGESTKDFVRRFKVESMDVKGAPEIMRISGFMHGITNPELIKRLHDKISKSVDEMMRITTSFFRGR
nr:reverse transcriptase domain-containing protein [Tanacetum cinerariifolium]